MEIKMMEKILTDLLNKYMNMEYELLPSILGYDIKQEVGRVNDMTCHVYSNEHNPPHFHVRNKDGSVDARFYLIDCKYMDGMIGKKDLKKIEAWFNDLKAKKIVTLAWDKLVIPPDKIKLRKPFNT